jgi:hypothetical protein
VLYQPQLKPIVHKCKSVGAVPAPAPKRGAEKRRCARGSSHSRDRTSVKELALAKLLKPSKKFVSHSSGPSSADGGSATPFLARALDLFDTGSSTSDAEPTNLVLSRKCPRKSPILKAVPKPSEAPTAKHTLEQLLFLCSS